MNDQMDKGGNVGGATIEVPVTDVPVTDSVRGVAVRTSPAGDAGADGRTGELMLEAIDLQFAEDSQLTLTVADLEKLSKASNELTVHGGVDDTVTIIGATETGETQDIGGRTYKVYDFGPNGGSVIIDEEINVIT